MFHQRSLYLVHLYLIVLSIDSIDTRDHDFKIQVPQIHIDLPMLGFKNIHQHINLNNITAPQRLNHTQSYWTVSLSLIMSSIVLLIDSWTHGSMFGNL